MTLRPQCIPLILEFLLSCGAVGDPNPALKWVKLTGNRVLPQTRILISPLGNLTIYSLRLSDSAQYECICVSPVLTLSRRTVVYVESMPHHPPTNLTCELGFFSAYLRWTPGFHVVSPIHYVIVCKRLSSIESKIVTIRVRPNNATSFKITNLLPDTAYEILVKSQTSDGFGNFSKPLHIHTCTLSIMPKTVTVTATNNHFNMTTLTDASFNDQSFQGSPLTAFQTEKPTSFPFGATFPIEDNEPRPYDMWIPKGVPPAPPHNLSVVFSEFVQNGEFAYVNITWFPPLSTAVPIVFFLVQFKDLSRVYRSTWETMGDRVPIHILPAPVPLGPLSPGRKYAFRVFSFSRQVEFRIRQMMSIYYESVNIETIV
jgi:hypothetical protein